MTRSRFSLLTLALSATLAVPVLAHDPQPAQAEVSIRVRGDVNVRVGKPRVRIRVRPHQYTTPRHVVRLHGGLSWGGSVYVGTRFAQPPPPPPPPPSCDCDNGSVPAYYTPPPAPTYYAPAPTYAPAPVVAQAAEPALPRFGIGVFAGSIEVEEQNQGKDAGIFARLRLSDALMLEVETARTEMKTDRTDRRVGGTLLYDFAPYRRWSAHLLAGGGVTRVDIDDSDWHARQEYGEVGAGLTWKLRRNLHLAGDLRAGARVRVDQSPTDPALKSVAPSSTEEETYTRGRLSAILYF